jgi:hypothetical protein
MRVLKGDFSTVKQMVQFSRLIWSAHAGMLVSESFELELDTDKIPLNPLKKAITNKGGKSKSLSGAVIIRPAAK